MRIDVVLEMEEKIGLSKLVKEGIVDINLMRDKDIYLQYGAYRTSGLKSAEALRRLSDSFSLEIRAIQRIIAKMKS